MEGKERPCECMTESGEFPAQFAVTHCVPYGLPKGEIVTFGRFYVYF